MHLKFTLRLEVIVLSIVLLTCISLVPALQTEIYGQLQQQQPQEPLPTISIKITSPSTGQQLAVGENTISGISSDNATSDCTVYVDWNNTKPFQKAIATGPGGVNDYSRWTFTYTDKYHLITNGTNNLTSKLSCFNDNNNTGTTNLTKSNSVNVIGVIEPSERSVSSAAEQQNNVSDGASSLAPIKKDNNTDITTTTTGPESNPSVPITPSPEPRDNENTTIYWDIQ
jgi:hypothetical protein